VGIHIMADLAQRALQIKPSPTIAMNKRAADMTRDGRDVIPLSLGEPDFHTAEHVKDAGIAAIERNFTKYTNSEGFGPLKQAVAGKLLRENGLAFSADQVVIGSGSKSVFLAAFWTVVDPGCEVVIPAPYWVSYPDLVELAGGTPVIVPCSESAGFKLTPDDLERAITPRTRAIVFNSPNNPTGAVYSEAEIRALAAVLEKHPKVWVVTDELYEHIVYDNTQVVYFAKAAPGIADRVVTVCGFSKSYVMTGWRLSFAAGNPSVMKAIGDLLSQIHGAPSSIAQAAAIEALEGDQSFIRKNQKVFKERRDLVVERANSIPGLHALRPPGAFYVYVNCGPWIGRTSAGGKRLANDIDVVEALLEEAAIATVPGTVFGLSPYFRISYALELERLRTAMDRLEEFSRGLR
jgi:aspartate aminotransferase